MSYSLTVLLSASIIVYSPLFVCATVRWSTNHESLLAKNRLCLKPGPKIKMSYYRILIQIAIYLVNDVSIRRYFDQGWQHFSTIKCTNQVYNIPCPHSYVKRWEFRKACFRNVFLFDNLYTIVPYGVHNGSPDFDDYGWDTCVATMVSKKRMYMCDLWQTYFWYSGML